MTRIGVVLLLAVSMVVVSAHAATPAETAGKMLFVKPVALRGTLGGEQVQVNLHTKADFEDGIEGDYFRFGSSQKTLLVGEIEGEELFLEESENGSDVSGQWEGKLAGDVITGEWQSVDGKISKPFQIRIVSPTSKRNASTSVKPSKQ